MTWPLLWPVTALVLTLQLILQLKLFDQIYLMTQGGPFNSSYVLLLLVYREAFQLNHGGYGATIAIVLVRAHRGHLGAAVPAPAHRRPAMRSGSRLENGILTVATLVAAAIWFFPLYWAIVTSLRTDESVVAGAGLIPDQFKLAAYIERALQHQARSPGTSTRSAPRVIITVDRHRLRHDVRLRDLAAALPRPRPALRRRARELHDADPGALRVAVRADERSRLGQHLGRASSRRS